MMTGRTMLLLAYLMAALPFVAPACGIAAKDTETQSEAFKGLSGIEESLKQNANGTWALETAVRQLSFAGARRHGLSGRGLLLPGCAADVIVFDPDAVRDHATYADGKAFASGMTHVFVNGAAVLRDGERTGALPGRGLRRG